jgi:hypothetical protein
MGVTKRKKKLGRRRRRPTPPKIHPLALQSFSGAVHLGFANGTGVAVNTSSTEEPIALFSFLDPGCREIWGGSYSANRVLNELSDKLIEAECEWLIPVLEAMVRNESFLVSGIIDAYRERYGTDPSSGRDVRTEQI